ncbi:MAG: type II secretion system F family protein [Eubacterium sp.]|nr:type II secretion system F family protein [Eubacterium sp.]
MTGLQIKMILIALIYGILAGIIVYLIVKQSTRNQRSAEKRVKNIVGSTIGSEVVLQKKKKGMRLGWLNGRQKKTTEYVQKKSLLSKIGDAILEELLSANIMMNAEEFATIWIVLAFVPAALSSLFINNPALPIVLVLAGALGPIIFIRVRKQKRISAFEDQLSDAFMIAASSLRSGLSFQQAMETIARDMYPPVSDEFARAVKEINMGFSIDEALDNVYKRVQSDDFKIAAVAISVQRTTGGNLSEILETISDTIKERAQLKKEVKSATATGRMSGMVVGLMPVAIVIMLNVASPGYMDPLFETNGGKIAILVGIMLEIIGLIVIKKITTIKY